MADPNEGDLLAQFIVNAPLYTPTKLDLKATARPKELPGPILRTIELPKVIKRPCHVCGGIPNWTYGINLKSLSPGMLQAVDYWCQSCHRGFGVWIVWAIADSGNTFEKVGEYPAREIKPPKEVASRLGDHDRFWRRAMLLRHQGYGIGALTYFRRMIEDMTNEMLELLARAMEARGDIEEDVKNVRRLIAEKVTYDVKIGKAADVYPAAVRPGGINPFAMIFEIVSSDIHTGTDEECCLKVDVLASVVARFVARVNEELEAKREIDEAAKLLHKEKSKPT